jgi:predicted DNA-binding protein
MPRKEVIQIRLSEEEKDKLQAIADEEKTTKSDILREHIISLPDPRDKKK